MMFHIDGTPCYGQYESEVPGDPESKAVLVPGTCTHWHHGPAPDTPAEGDGRG